MNQNAPNIHPREVRQALMWFAGVLWRGAPWAMAVGVCGQFLPALLPAARILVIKELVDGVHAVYGQGEAGFATVVPLLAWLAGLRLLEAILSAVAGPRGGRGAGEDELEVAGAGTRAGSAGGAGQVRVPRILRSHAAGAAGGVLPGLWHLPGCDVHARKCYCDLHLDRALCDRALVNPGGAVFGYGPDFLYPNAARARNLRALLRADARAATRRVLGGFDDRPRRRQGDPALRVRRLPLPHLGGPSRRSGSSASG